MPLLAQLSAELKAGLSWGPKTVGLFDRYIVVHRIMSRQSAWSSAGPRVGSLLAAYDVAPRTCGEICLYARLRRPGSHAGAVAGPLRPRSAVLVRSVDLRRGRIVVGWVPVLPDIDI